MKFYFLIFLQLNLIQFLCAQLFDQIPSQIKGEFDRFEQLNSNSEPPKVQQNQINLQDLILQAKNLVEKKSNQNFLEPPKKTLTNISNPPSFLAQNPENSNEMRKNENNERENENFNKRNEIIVDGEKYEYNELKEIIEFNKKLVKLCKVDFSNCFDIKKSILPRKKVLSLLIDDNDNSDKNEENEKNEIKSNDDSFDYEVNQKIEDDLIDLGLK